MNKVNGISSFIALAAIMLLAALPLYGKPVFHIGMTRAEVAKALPEHKKVFGSAEATVRIEAYSLHGMKGDAAFMFKHNKLILFLWQYEIKGKSPSDVERLQYSKLLRGLEKEWGEPYRTEVMANDPGMEKWYWRLATSSGHTDYTKGQLKFIIADNDWLDSVKPSR